LCAFESKAVLNVKIKIVLFIIIAPRGKRFQEILPVKRKFCRLKQNLSLILLLKGFVFVKNNEIFVDLSQIARTGAIILLKKLPLCAKITIVCL